MFLDGGINCTSQIPRSSIEVSNIGDSLRLTCDPNTQCVNSCSWKMPSGTTCSFSSTDTFNNHPIQR